MAMYRDFVCSVQFGDEPRTMRYGVSAGNELEVEEAIRRGLEDVEEVSDIRLATPGERASLRLSAGMMRPLN
jgi:hypothetical protein